MCVQRTKTKWTSQKYESVPILRFETVLKTCLRFPLKRLDLFSAELLDIIMDGKGWRQGCHSLTYKNCGLHFWFTLGTVHTDLDWRRLRNKTFQSSISLTFLKESSLPKLSGQLVWLISFPSIEPKWKILKRIKWRLKIGELEMESV